jgi:hypothetical protein
MNFWTVTTCIKDSKDPIVFLVQSPYNKIRTKEILFEVHPEYQRMTLKKAKRPPGAVTWSE